MSSSAAAAASPPPPPSAPQRTHDQLMSALDDLVPPLTRTNHKGQHGKVGVVGGCLEYTGAPYFAAMSAIKVGADLAHVFCTPAAAGPLKTYSPELIVLPYLPEGEEAHLAGAAEEIQASAVARSAQRVGAWLPRLTCLIIGPGLGDDPGVVEASRAVLLEARRQGLPLIIDGSGLNFVAKVFFSLFVLRCCFFGVCCIWSRQLTHTQQQQQNDKHRSRRSSPAAATPS